MHQKHKALWDKISADKAIKDETKKPLNDALNEFKAIFVPSTKH